MATREGETFEDAAKSGEATDTVTKEAFVGARSFGQAAGQTQWFSFQQAKTSVSNSSDNCTAGYRQSLIRSARFLPPTSRSNDLNLTEDSQTVPGTCDVSTTECTEALCDRSRTGPLLSSDRNIFAQAFGQLPAFGNSDNHLHPGNPISKSTVVNPEQRISGSLAQDSVLSQSTGSFGGIATSSELLYRATETKGYIRSARFSPSTCRASDWKFKASQRSPRICVASTPNSTEHFHGGSGPIPELSAVKDTSAASFGQLPTLGNKEQFYSEGQFLKSVDMNPEQPIFGSLAQDRNLSFAAALDEIGVEVLRQKTKAPEEIALDPLSLEVYELALKEGKEKDTGVRINIVGNFKQGKTSLLRRILQQPLTDVQCTNGIDIQRVICSKDDLNKSVVEYGSKNLVQRLLEVVDNCQISPGSCRLQKAVQTYSSNPPKSRSNVRPCVLKSHTFVLSKEEQAHFRKEILKKERQTTRLQTTLHFWDFGGQYSFYATHALFHSSRAIYLLVFNLSTQLSEVVCDEEFPNENESRPLEFYTRFWMDSIHSFVGTNDGLRPIVILVGTHKDLIKGENVEKCRYIERYFNRIRELFDGSNLLKHIYHEDFAVDNTSSDDPKLAELRETIVRLGDNISSTVETPAKWIPLEKSLNDSDKKVMTLSEVQRLASGSECPLDDVEEIRVFLKYHHAKGTYIYFDEPGLSEYVIIDPKFLVDAFKTIITCDRFRTSNPEIRPLWKTLLSEAKLEPELIDRLWSGKHGESFIDFKDVILKFLSRHRIIAEATKFDEIKKESSPLGWYVVPSLLRVSLDKSEIETFFQKKNRTSLRFVIKIKYSTIVALVFHRLLAAVIGRWSIVQFHSRALLFHNACIVRLNETHAGLVELRETAVDFSVVSLCPSMEVDRRQTDSFRRFSESVVQHEFSKLNVNDRTNNQEQQRPYIVQFRCNHADHKGEGSMSFIEDSPEDVVPCPDLLSHEINIKWSKSEWYPDINILNTRDLNIDISDKLLSKLSTTIGKNWEMLGLELGVSNVSLEHIQMDYNRSRKRIYHMLLEWRKSNPFASLQTLLDIMKRCSCVTIDWDALKNIVQGF